MLALLSFLAAGSAQAQSGAAPTLPDPARCVVVIDDAGDVGLRISDAQQAHEVMISHLRKRLGNDAVVYEGAQKNAQTMKRMLGPQSETSIQDAQLAYFDAAIKAAAFRVKVKFGKKKNEQFITASCRKAGEKKEADSRTFTGKTFLEARDAMAAGLDSFCLLLPQAATQVPIEGATGSSTTAPVPQKKKKELKPWTPPPRRD